VLEDISIQLRTWRGACAGVVPPKLTFLSLTFRVVNPPWTVPGVELADFFNYGLTPETWKDYQGEVWAYRQEFEAAMNAGAGAGHVPPGMMAGGPPPPGAYGRGGPPPQGHYGPPGVPGAPPPALLGPGGYPGGPPPQQGGYGYPGQGPPGQMVRVDGGRGESEFFLAGGGGRSRADSDFFSLRAAQGRSPFLSFAAQFARYIVLLRTLPTRCGESKRALFHTV